MNRNMNYIAQLRRATILYKSIMCFGLDPVIAAMHKKFSNAGIEGFYYMLQELFAYMKEQKVFPGAFKPNHGFYSIYGNGREYNFRGLEVLGKILNLIEEMFPNMPAILDFKRGDIGKSSANYGVEGFEFWNADAATIAPYMGGDSMRPFAEWCDKQPQKAENRGVYALNLTSNPGANDFEMQDMANGKKLYMKVAEWIRDNAEKHPGLGAVVGAPDLNGLRDIAKFYNANPEVEVPLLIPGINGLNAASGGQGGRADEVVTVLKYVGYDISIVRPNVSSGLTHPWGEKNPAPDDWKKIIVDNLFQYNKLTGMA